MKEEEEKKKVIMRDWCDLPIEIPILIKSSLSPTEWNKFDEVFPNVPNPPVPIPTECPIPHSKWLMSIPTDDKGICNFFHPMYKQDTFVMKVPELHGSIMRCFERDTNVVMKIPELHSSFIRCSKYGWLLMSKDLRSVFFFNPFTKAKIELPTLPGNLLVEGISFSSPPTSSDCIVFGVHGYSDYGVYIAFIRRGQETWTLSEIGFPPSYHPSYCTPVFYNEAFYCLGVDGNMGVFDTRDEKWRILSDPISPMKKGSIDECFLMESNGELLSVFVGKEGTSVNVFSLDRCSMVWEEVKCLGDRMLFLSHTACYAMNSIEGMENKIYLQKLRKNNEGVFYSLESRRYHTYGDTNWSSKNFDRLKERQNCTWIEPVEEWHSIEELDWLSNSKQERPT